jgi:hypothetical protein
VEPSATEDDLQVLDCIYVNSLRSDSISDTLSIKAVNRWLSVSCHFSFIQTKIQTLEQVKRFR